VTIRDAEYNLSGFLHVDDAFDLMQRLTDLAMKKLISEEDEFSVDVDLLLKSSKNIDQSLSVVHRDLKARALSSQFQTDFNLSREDKLDGKIECVMFTPYNRKWCRGTLYISANYVCFASVVPDLVRLTIPLRDVAIAHKRRKKNNNTSPNNNTTTTLIVDTKRKERFVFTQIADLDFVLRKISDLLWNVHQHREDARDTVVHLDKEEDEEEEEITDSDGEEEDKPPIKPPRRKKRTTDLTDFEEHKQIQETLSGMFEQQLFST
jgi:hypothetical protein